MHQQMVSELLPNFQVTDTQNGQIPMNYRKASTVSQIPIMHIVLVRWLRLGRLYLSQASHCTNLYFVLVRGLYVCPQWSGYTTKNPLKHHFRCHRVLSRLPKVRVTLQEGDHVAHFTQISIARKCENI